ncbi:DNA repair protein [Pedobacter psychrodurus]|uniref:DNA repair protein n=1 Tax=Pedobacter psychrodurus TaxID=2530456 RepID=A0A4R0PG25_9SPHI|nr:JAB domain-containing protein [Pedobacter psychrodurus]TCD16972.1 DNA repair protein [Pedobacter psychrodurus]
MAQKTFKIAEVQVSYKPDYKASERPKITSSKQAYDLLMRQWDLGKIEFLEQSKMILLNRENRVLGIVDISTGGVSGTILDPKIIFSIALKANTSSIIISHNHPSGNLKPSHADIRLTNQLKDGGKLLEIVVWDHLVISNDNYYSFADDGMM